MTQKIPFERVVTAHGATILRVCRAVTRNEHDADDAWSDTFLAALRAWPDMPADVNVEAWLVTIAHHKAIDILRARREISFARPPETPTADPDALTRLDIEVAVRALPSRQRFAVAYHYLAGLRYAEVAEVTGGTEQTVRRAAADGMKTLRGVFDAEGELYDFGNKD
jgi:RNA polymerase sigma factor (sigma-70 family)